MKTIMLSRHFPLLLLVVALTPTVAHAQFDGGFGGGFGEEWSFPSPPGSSLSSIPRPA